VDHVETQVPAAGSRRAGPSPELARKAYGLAVAALVISIAAPFAADPLLGTINIRTPMSHRLAEATQQVSRLEQRSSELEQHLAAIMTQLAQQQTQTGQAAAQIDKIQVATRTLALVQFGAALRRPGPFDLELAVLRASGAAPPQFEPQLLKVEPYAATGVPGFAQLQMDFAGLRARVDRAEVGNMPMAWMNRLVAWPRGASSPSADPSQTDSKYLSDATSELNKLNLANAVAIVQPVAGLSRELLSDWIEDAQARVALDDLARRINDLVVQQQGNARPAH
jgi:hypothetical protein